MALIEGVGDEVTILFALVLLFSIVVLAWISTHTAERGASHWSSSTDAPVSEQHEEPPLAGVPNSRTDPAPPPPSDYTEEQSPLPPAEGPPEPALTSDTADRGSSAPGSPSLRRRGPGAPAEAAQTIQLRLKFLNDSERVVSVCLSDTILHIKRTHFPGEESRVRLIYQGQLLRDDSQTVASLQLTNGCVLHCHVSQHAPPPGHGSAELPEVPLNIGSLLVPLLVLILAVLWYSKFQYPHVFTATATVCLAAISLLVTVITCATYRR